MTTMALQRTLVASILTAACAGNASPGEADGARNAGQVVEGARGCIVGSAPLTVGEDIYAYIEPESLFRAESGFVVVGTPSYTFAPGADGARFRESENVYLAARFGLDGGARLIEKPMDVAIGTVRAAKLGGDRWGVLFDELAPPTREVMERSRRLWYAEHDGTRWSWVEPVPFPDEGYPDMHSSSDLVATSEGLVWVVAVRLPDGFSEMLEYRRREGEWTTDVISKDWVETSALASTASTGLVMAYFAHDQELPGFQKSFRLFRRSAQGWELVRRLAVAEPRSVVWTLDLNVVGDDTSVAWFVDAANEPGVYVARVAASNGDSTPTKLDSSGFQIFPLGPDLGRASWLVRHVDAARERTELRLYNTRSGGAVEMTLSVPNPYPGNVAAALTAPGELLVIGADVNLDPMNGYLRSLLLRLTTSCT